LGKEAQTTKEVNARKGWGAHVNKNHTIEGKIRTYGGKNEMTGQAGRSGSRKEVGEPFLEGDEDLSGNTRVKSTCCLCNRRGGGTIYSQPRGKQLRVLTGRTDVGKIHRQG